MPPVDSIEIARRFCGPPQSGNGGYVCGRLGSRLAGTATVRLLAPPPLETPLQVETREDGLRLWQVGTAIAEARRDVLDLEAPAAPTLEQAREASQRYAGFASHPFPGCFVCGPARAEGDGLRIFPAAVPGRGLVAAPWTPGADLADAGGQVRPEFVWSALDCTGFFSFGPLPDGSPALLGELTARIDQAISAGQPHVVAGWLIGGEGRKRVVGSAIYDAGGRLLALARATWIIIPPSLRPAIG